MVRLAACLAGTYLIAFAMTSLVVARPDAPSGGDAASIAVDAEPKRVAVKGDRLPRGLEATEKRRVAEIELFGADDLTVILRDGEGREIYRVDHASNMTIAARDVVLPQLRLHAQVSDGVGQNERVRENSDRNEPLLPPRSLDEESGEGKIFACESGLSALADRKAAAPARLCLAGSTENFAKYAAVSRELAR